MKIFIFALASFGLAAAVAMDDLSGGYYSERLSARFPPKISTMELKNVADYESRKSGLGVGLSYRAEEIRAEEIRADIYIYDMTIPEIPDGIYSEAAEMSMRWSAMEIEELAIRKVYARFKEIEGAPMKKYGSTKFLFRKYSFIESGAQKESMLLMTCASGNFIKVRLTYNLISDADMKGDAEQFLESVASIIESGGKAQNKRPNQMTTKEKGE